MDPIQAMQVMQNLVGKHLTWMNLFVNTPNKSNMSAINIATCHLVIIIDWHRWTANDLHLQSSLRVGTLTPGSVDNAGR
jgi:hypothetical protein